VVAGWLVAAMLLSVVFFVLSLFKGRFDVRISSAKPG
jgi:thiosulfate reductase cytochrome b subunit